MPAIPTDLEKYPDALRAVKEKHPGFPDNEFRAWMLRGELPVYTFGERANGRPRYVRMSEVWALVESFGLYKPSSRA